MVSRQDIVEGLRQLGLKAGDVVVVHSSLSSFGRVDGGAATVVDAILQVVGPRGTLVVPTFNYRPDPFDSAVTRSFVGAVTEEVRGRPEAVRSLHPTHSVAAIGALARHITEGHEKTTAFGRGSSLYNVLQAGGKILQLGVSHTSNSMIHVAEEIVGVSYLERTGDVSIKTLRGVVRKTVRSPGCSRGFNAVEEALQQEKAIAETMIGECRARLMSARALVGAAVKMLEFDAASLLCTGPDCPVCAQSRAMLAASEAEKQDKEIIELAERDERDRRFVESQLESDEVQFFDTEGEVPCTN